MAADIISLFVVIPAHNEQQTLAASIGSVQQSMRHLGQRAGHISVRLAVVLDACTDDSEAVARSLAADDSRLDVVIGNLRNVGAARALGIHSVLRRLSPDVDLERVGICCTDADTRVPEHWLEALLDDFNSGADVVLGTVEPDPREIPAAIFEQWAADYQMTPGHPHVHGANLAVRASAYATIGGFADLTQDEDVDLVRRLRAAGFRIHATERLHALTSGRLRGRVAAGFAGYLAALQFGSLRTG